MAEAVCSVSYIKQIPNITKSTWVKGKEGIHTFPVGHFCFIELNHWKKEATK